MTLFKSVFICFTIWVLTGLLNGVMAGSFIILTTEAFYQWPFEIIEVALCTLVCSIPGMFVFWLVMLFNWKQELLFRRMLLAGFIITALSTFLVFCMPDFIPKNRQVGIAVLTIISITGSLMMHHRYIKAIYHPPI